MRWWAMVMVATVACALDAEPCQDDGDRRAREHAYLAFRWACAHAARCGGDCDAQRWSYHGTATLRAAEACLYGPCEERGRCLADASSLCPAQDVRVGPDSSQDVHPGVSAPPP